MKGTVAIVGSGPAGLFAAWALQNDEYEVTVFEKHDYLTLARHSDSAKGTASVDIPMRTFSGSYYVNLFQALNYLKVETRVHRFHYSFYNESRKRFQFFSNFHRITPCLGNGIWVNIYAFICYLWYTIAVFLLPPHVKGTKPGQHETESLEHYIKRVRLPDSFLDLYLLPLFSSVATCSHTELRNCPAAYIADYRKRTFGAHHRTVASMQTLQDCLTRDVTQHLQTEVHSIQPQSGGVMVRFTTANDQNIRTQIFNHVILATSSQQAGRLLAEIRPITSQLNEGQVRISVSVSQRPLPRNHRSEPLILQTRKDPTLGLITRSQHLHPAGLDVVVSPCFAGETEPIATEDQVIYLSRPLPTTTSHDLLFSVLGNASSDRHPTWRNGQGGVYLAGGYAFAGLPLLEACVRSGLEAATAIGANLPFEIVRATVF